MECGLANKINMPEKFSAFKKSTIIIIILKPYRKKLKEQNNTVKRSLQMYREILGLAQILEVKKLL